MGTATETTRNHNEEMKTLKDRLYDVRYSVFHQYGLTEDEIKQILENQEKVEKLEKTLHEAHESDYELRSILTEILKID